MALGVPPNAPAMSDARPADTGLSVLSLHIEVADRDPDWPMVSIRVDGNDPFREVADGWLGFDPAEILGAESPLLPTEFGRRVAVRRCSCGEAGCGVIAPTIVGSPDGRRISWIDFRDYVGVFISPVGDEATDDDGEQWDLPDVHFDRDQYVAEVARASEDRSWETPRRRVARLVHQQLMAAGVTIDPVPREPADAGGRQVLTLSSAGEQPDDGARLFGHDPSTPHG